MKYRLEIELDLTDWIDENDKLEREWLERVITCDTNKFFFGGDIGDDVDLKLISFNVVGDDDD